MPPASKAADARRARIDIIVPTYNYGRYLDQCLSSVRAQTFADYSVLIIDNASDDGSEAIGQRWEAADARFRYVRNPTNLGLRGSLQKAYGLTSNELVLILSSDDLIAPTFLEKAVTALDTHPECSFAYSAWDHFVDKPGTPEHGHRIDAYIPHASSGIYPESTVLLSHNWITNSICVFRRRVCDEIGGITPTQLLHVGDWYLWMAFAARGPAYHIAEKLGHYRIHGAAETDRLLADNRSGPDHLHFYDVIAGSELWPAPVRLLARAHQARWLTGTPLSATVRAMGGETAHPIMRSFVAPFRDDIYVGAARAILEYAPNPEFLDTRDNALSLLADVLARNPGHADALSLAAAHGGRPGVSILPSRYAQWLLTHGTASAPSGRPQADFLLVVDARDHVDAVYGTLDSIAAQSLQPMHVLVVHDPAATLALGDSAGTTPVPADALDQALPSHAATAGCWLLALSAGDVLDPHALAIAAQAISSAGHEAAVLYFDHDSIATDGTRSNPHFKPDANPDLLRSYPYTGRALLVRGDWLAQQATGIPLDLAASYDLALRALETAGEAALLHVPEVALHLTPAAPAVWAETEAEAAAVREVLDAHARRSMPGSELADGPARGIFHLYPPLYDTPLVSIIIPTKDQLPLLKRCLETVVEKTSYPNYEILVVDNASETPEAQQYLEGLATVAPDRIRVIAYPGAFNFSAMNNRAAELARGELLLLLNNDTAAIQADWLTNLVRHALRPEVGVVGPCLFFPNGRIQHAGVVLGLRGPADHPFIGLPADAPGYLYRAQVQQNYSAVTGACLLIRKALYQDVGRLDEQSFAVSYNDIDLCLKVRTAGKLVVWTPLALMLHESSASQLTGVERLADERKRSRFRAEAAAMYARWGALIARDPAYNPNLSLDGEAFTLPAPPEGSARSAPARPAAEAPSPRRTDDDKPSALESIDRTSYHLWQNQRRPDAHDLANLRAHALRWPSLPSVHIVCRVASAAQFPLLAQTLESLNGQIYGNWRADVVSTEASPGAALDALPQLAWHAVSSADEMRHAINLLVTTHRHDWICEVPPGAVLDPLCLFRVLDGALRAGERARAVYVDDDVHDARGVRHSPRLKPDFDANWLRSADILGPIFVAADTWHACGGASRGGKRPWYELALRVVRHGGDAAIAHVAEPLISLPESLAGDGHAGECRAAVARQLRDVGIEADIAAVSDTVWHVRYPMNDRPTVTIAIPSLDRPEMLGPCIDAILRQTLYANYDILVVDGGSTDAETLRLLASLETRAEAPVRVVRCDAPFSLPVYGNCAAQAAAGDFLLLLGDDVRILAPDWLEGLLRHALRADVVAVGPRIATPPSGNLEHSGYTLGLEGFAGTPHRRRASVDDAGYLDVLRVTRSVAALPGACLLVRRSAYLAAGGMDADALAETYADIDLSLRLRANAAGQCIATSEVTVVKTGGSCLDPLFTWPTELAERDMRRLRAQETMLRRWFAQFASDRFYSRHLDRSGTEPAIEIRCIPSWHSLPLDTPRILAFPVQNAQGDIRLGRPLNALRAAGKALPCLFRPTDKDATLPATHDLARHAPDILITHQPIGPSSVIAMRQWREFLEDTFIVYECDDLLTDMPKRSSLRLGIPADARSYLARALESCDRLVVSTAYLAERYGPLAKDVRIVPNRLERDVWLPLRSQRDTGPRPRVGWAGGTTHEGDLQQIAEVIAATSKEVDWIFMGMCPANIRPHVAEFHPFGDFDAYPARLAALNLDLAVAPLELLPFNRGKSNLRLLEYGALGIPVVCTDIDPYRGSPACRIANNRPDRWIGALRERVHDPDAARREGEAMRRWVVDNFILEDHLDEWLAAYSPGA